MELYKSKKIIFFKNNKIISLGELVTPKTVDILSKLFLKNHFFAGKTVEFIIVFCFLLSIFFYLK